MGDPSLEQLLYKLAIEAAGSLGKKADLNLLKTHEKLGTFHSYGQEKLTARIEEYIKAGTPESIATSFFENYVKPVIDQNIPLETVLNEDFLSGYDVPTLEKIHEHVEKNLELSVANKLLKNLHEKPLDTILKRFDHHTVSYLINLGNSYPVDAFNEMVREHSNNLSALKKIQKKDIERRLRASQSDQNKICSIEETKNVIKRKIEDILTSTQGNYLFQLDNLIGNGAKERFGKKKCKKLKQRVKARVLEICSTEQNHEELRNFAKLNALLSHEEIDLLERNKIVGETIEQFDSLTYQQAVDFITKLPRMNFEKSTKEAIRQKAIERTNDLYAQTVQNSVNSCFEREQELTYQHVQEEDKKIKLHEIFAQKNTDILLPEKVKSVINEAHLLLGVLGTKKRIEATTVFDQDYQCAYQIECNRKLNESILNQKLKIEPTPMARPHIDGDGLSGLSVFQK